MITVSDTYRDAVAYSRTTECIVDFYRGGERIWEAAPVIAGKLTSDRGALVRMNCDVTLAVPEWEELPIDNRTSRFRVRRGISSLGFTETVQLGEFRVDDITRPAIGAVAIKGSGLEAYLQDARFLTPRTPPYGTSTVAAITTLIQEVLPGQSVVIRATRDRRVTATAVWKTDRVEAVDNLGASINAEVFADHSGRFIIADKPNPLSGFPVYAVDEGDDGVLVDRSEKTTRDRVYNAASVSGQSTDTDVAPVWAWAADLNPASPTYFYGPFGQKPIFYTSQFFTTVAQCQGYANQLLLEAMADNTTIGFDQLPVDFLEVGDLLALRRRQGSLEQMLLQSFDMELGIGGSMSCETLSSKIIIADGV